MATVQDLEAIGIGSPPCIPIGQHGEAGDRTGIAVEEPVVVGEHAPGKPAVALALDLGVDVDPAWFALLEGDLDQGIGKAFAEFGIAHHLAQFSILECMALCPIDLGMCASTPCCT